VLYVNKVLSWGLWLKIVNIITGENRISRFHDEKGNFVDSVGLLNAIPAFASAAAKRLFGYRPLVPMISYRARREINRFLTTESHMVEFGSGNSTPWFAARAGFVLSIEDLPHWHDHVQQILANHKIDNVSHELRSEKTYADLSNIDDGTLDFAMIDGTDREGCILSVIPKLKPGGILYLDNSDKDMSHPIGDLRRAEAALHEAVRLKGGSIRCFSDFSPTNFFVEQGMLARL
jgi:hypothetical protein